MTWAILAAIILLGLFFSAFFSGAETGLYCINRLRLHLGVQSGDAVAIRLASVIDDDNSALSVTLIGTNIANYITTSAAVYALADLAGFTETDAELYTILLLTPVVFVFGEVVPKNLFRLHADTLLRRGHRLLALSNGIFRLTGIVWCLARLATAINHFAAGDEHRAASLAPKRRVAAMLQEALVDNSFGKDQSDLIDRVCRLSEVQLHRLMIPRSRVTVIHARADRRELMRIVRRTGHARLPVFETDRRRIVGVIRVDRLLQSDDWTTVREHMRSVVGFGPHETVAAAMSHLQRARRGMAVVCDDGGRMLGIVVLKDLVSEVVGSLPDGV